MEMYNYEDYENYSVLCLGVVCVVSCNTTDKQNIIKMGLGNSVIIPLSP